MLLLLPFVMPGNVGTIFFDLFSWESSFVLTSKKSFVWIDSNKMQFFLFFRETNLMMSNSSSRFLLRVDCLFTIEQKNASENKISFFKFKTGWPILGRNAVFKLKCQSKATDGYFQDFFFQEIFIWKPNLVLFETRRHVTRSFDVANNKMSNVKMLI